MSRKQPLELSHYCWSKYSCHLKTSKNAYQAFVKEKSSGGSTWEAFKSVKVYYRPFSVSFLTPHNTSPSGKYWKSPETHVLIQQKDEIQACNFSIKNAKHLQGKIWIWQKLSHQLQDLLLLVHLKFSISALPHNLNYKIFIKNHGQTDKTGGSRNTAFYNYKKLTAYFLQVWSQISSWP